jgi:uncharacterized protein YheU (UPF0270 family)
MFIPHTAISVDALKGVIEEFVSREGTDYGATSFSLESKVASVVKQLESGQAFLVFDPASETCDIVMKGSKRYRELRVAELGTQEE